MTGKLGSRLRWALLLSWLRIGLRDLWDYRPFFVFRFRRAFDEVLVTVGPTPTILPDPDDVWACPWHLTNVRAVLVDGTPLGEYRRCKLPREIRQPVLLNPLRVRHADEPLPIGRPALGHRSWTLRYLPNAREAVYG